MLLVNDRVGEGMSLTCGERMKITEEWAKACTKTNQHLMVQVGGTSFKEVQDMVKFLNLSNIYLTLIEIVL